MNRRVCSAAFVFLCGCGLFAAGCSRGASEAPTAEAPAKPEVRIAKGRLSFLEDYEGALDVARQQGQPLLVYFTAQWCGFCHQMAHEAFNDDKVVDLSNRFVCVLVDADRHPDLCQRHQVRGYPTIVFLSPHAAPLNRVVGKQAGHQLVIQMQAALQAVARRGETPEELFR